MFVTLVLFVIFAVAFVAAAIVKKLANRWALLPDFIGNRVGGRFAVCSAVEFDEAPLETFPRVLSGEVRHFRRVRETLSFTADSREESFLACLFNMESSHELFVPLASETFMCFEDQKNFFMPEEDVYKFSKSKRKENRERDFRRRLSFWVQRHDLGSWQVLFALLSLVTLLVLGLMSADRQQKTAEAMPVTVHTTDTANATVRTVTVAGEEKEWVLMTDGVTGSALIKAKVFKIMPVGGGNSRVCALRTNGHVRCGFAALALNLKERDEVYFRKGEFVWWAFGTKDRPKTEVDDYVLTKAEADALVATGKFRIID